MGIKDLLGLTKKEPFRVPPEATALRRRIEAEDRENFPNVSRFRELRREAESVYRILDAIVAKKTNAEDASRIAEDIQKRMNALQNRIAKNLKDAKREGNEDYVDNNMEYLERKSARNAAKELFTEFLEAHERLLNAGRGGAQLQADQLYAATERIVMAVEELRQNYFDVHTKDREIGGMQEILCEKLTELSVRGAQDLSGIRNRELRAGVEANLRKIAAFQESCR